MPRLTIGMPAYNNAATIRTAVEALLAQDFGDFQLVISDDCSSDATPEVCAVLARSDRRVEYVRQERNLGYRNFGYLLSGASSDYFMWAAADDRHEPAFVAACIAELEGAAGAGLAISRVRFESAGEAAGFSDGTYALTAGVAENLQRYFSTPGDNSRMYGVFRRALAQRCFPATPFHAYDWAFSAATLKHGIHLEVPAVLMHRDLTPWQRYTDLAYADGKNPLDRVLPLMAMTRWLLSDARIPGDRKVLAALLALNLDKHLEYASLRHPRYHRLIGPLERFWHRKLRWRLRYSDQP